MKKIAVRCYIDYAQADGVYNIEIYSPLYGFGYGCDMATCTCGELFAFDRENPKTAGKTVQELGREKFCPKCNSLLEETLHNYPQTFMLKSGKKGNFIPSDLIAGDKETLIVEFWNLMS